MPTENLRVALIPHDIVMGDVAKNLDIVEQRLESIRPDTDLVVLPEMFNSGFTVDLQLLQSMAEDDHGRTMQRVAGWVKRFGFAIWGGFTAKIDNRYFNRGFMAMPDGSIEFYNKRHLFQAGGESRIFTPGMEQCPIMQLKGWNLKMSICYDIRFPVWNRSVANEYDALIVPANWAHSRFHAWKQMLIARAIENQAFVVGCNRGGRDIYGSYELNDSQAFDHFGYDIAERCEDGTVYATFDAGRFVHDRLKFRPWMDADDFELVL